MLAEGLVASYSKMSSAMVTVQCVVANDVPELVMLDPLRIAQVLANGVTNALKVTMKGTVGLHVRIVFLRGQKHLLFQVLDTGPGLHGKAYRKLFDPTGEGGALLVTANV